MNKHIYYNDNFYKIVKVNKNYAYIKPLILDRKIEVVNKFNMVETYKHYFFETLQDAKTLKINKNTLNYFKQYDEIYNLYIVNKEIENDYMESEFYLKPEYLKLKFEIENKIINIQFNSNKEEKIKSKIELIKFINNDANKIKILHELELYYYYVNITKETRENNYINIEKCNTDCPCCFLNDEVYINFFSCKHSICKTCYKLWTAKTCPTCRSL
jgi:hypothetical protein